MKTREKREKKNKKTLYLGLIIAFIMVTSIAGFVGNRDSDEEKYKYNKHLFIKVNDGWLTTIGNRQIFLKYGPRELESLNVNKVSLKDLNSVNKIYISFNPSKELERGVYELQNNVFSLLSTQLVRSCTDDIEGCDDKIIKNCKDADQYAMVISLRESNETSASYNNYCLNIQGKGEDLIMVVDKVILDLFEIV